MDPKYSLGQKVKIITLIDGYGRPDPRVKEWIGKTGEIVNLYYISGNEIWEKTLRMADVYSYDVRLEDGDIIRGIPEIGLEVVLFSP